MVTNKGGGQSIGSRKKEEGSEVEGRGQKDVKRDYLLSCSAALHLKVSLVIFFSPAPLRLSCGLDWRFLNIGKVSPEFVQ